MEGRLVSEGKKVKKPGEMIPEDSRLEVIPEKLYASRGGHKLEGAFMDFGLDASGRSAVDIGSSTGGFTDYLIKNGADIVTAVDVGYGLLSWELRNHEKVWVLEKQNIRDLDPSILGYKAELVTVDVSFISLKNIFKKIMDISSSSADILLLIKPQFELKKEFVKHKGVVLEKEYHIRILHEMVDFFRNFKVSIEGISFSRIKGVRGNIEFWIYLRKSINSAKTESNYDKIIGEVADMAHKFFAGD